MASRLTALALNGTLGPPPAESSTQLMIDEVLEALRGHDVADPYPGVDA